MDPTEGLKFGLYISIDITNYNGHNMKRALIIENEQKYILFRYKSEIMKALHQLFVFL